MLVCGQPAQHEIVIAVHPVASSATISADSANRRCGVAKCYLCAYIRNELPKVLDPAPAKSPVMVTEALGTCRKCGVWACRLHGTRYSTSAQFECAICTPAQAVQTALGITSDSVAVAQAKRVEPNPNSEAARSFALTLGRLRLASDRDAWIRDFEGVLGNTSSWDPERRG